MPRATTAAWLVMPPRAVRMPAAACMPWMSSGLVSMRTRMTSRPWRLQRLGLVGVEHDLAGGRAGRGRQAGRDARACSASGSMVGCSSWSSAAGSMRITASSLRDDALVGAGRRRSCSAAARGALARARLQHPELAVLDRELDVLHVAVVRARAGRRRRRSSANVSGISASSDGSCRRRPPCARPRSAAAACGCRRRRPRPAR